MPNWKRFFLVLALILGGYGIMCFGMLRPHVDFWAGVELVAGFAIFSCGWLLTPLEKAYNGSVWSTPWGGRYEINLKNVPQGPPRKIHRGWFED